MMADGNRFVAEWLAGIQEAVRNATGRAITVGTSHVAQDKLWAVKTFLLTERDLRPMTKLRYWEEQRRRWRELRSNLA